MKHEEPRSEATNHRPHGERDPLLPQDPAPGPRPRTTQDPSGPPAAGPLLATVFHRLLKLLLFSNGFLRGRQCIEVDVLSWG